MSKIHLFVLGLLALILFGFLYKQSWSQINFNAEQWRIASKEQNYKVRFRMKDDLLSYLKKSRPNLKKISILLGSPDQNPHYSIYKYKLGHEYIGITYYFIIVEYAQNDDYVKSYLGSD